MLPAGLAGWLLVSAPPALAAHQRPGPVVEFHGSGPVPLACTSTPNRVLVQVARGQWLNVVNRTGVRATVVVANHRLPVADGQGRSLRLHPRQYQVSMVPNCLVRPSDAHAATVDVTDDPPGSPTASTGTGPQGSRSAVAVDPAAQPDGLLEEQAYTPAASPELPSISLLGVIAAICVFGVTVSIIRAILAQRAARAVAKHRLRT
ncbi:MAG: hypothetical protein ACM30G_14625 [Micromonosporaceae bacterium]